jgi:hypothetical protein
MMHQLGAHPIQDNREPATTFTFFMTVRLESLTANPPPLTRLG